MTTIEKVPTKRTANISKVKEVSNMNKDNTVTLEENMSNFDEASESLRLLIRARTPIIYIISDEKEKILVDIIHKMCEEGTYGNKSKKTLFSWDCARGYNKHSMQKGRPIVEAVSSETLDPVTALDFIIDHESPEGDSNTLDNVYVLSEFHHYFREPSVQRRMRIFSEIVAAQKRKIIIMISTKNSGVQGKSIPLELENIVYLQDWPYPDSKHIELVLKEKIQLMNEKFRTLDPPVAPLNYSKEELEQIIGSCKGMTVKQIDEATTKSIVKNRTFDKNIICREKKQIIKKSGACDYIEPSENLSDIGGLDRLKSWLKLRKASFSEDAIEFGCNLPKGLLCVGAWGTGKTTVAKAIMNEYQIPGLRIDVSRMFGMYVGESENKTKEILNLADSIAPCVLWWDEVENIFSNSGQSNSGTDGGTSSRVLGLISTWMSEHKGLVFNVFTANDISDSPPKLFRKGRLDELFIVDLPVKVEREEILKIHVLKRLKIQNRVHIMDSIDFCTLASYSQNFSGAELEDCVNNAILKCYNEEKRDLKTEDIVESIKQTIPISCTMREPFEHIRQWGEGKAQRASKYPPEDLISKEHLLKSLNTIQYGSEDSGVNNLEL